MPFQRYIYCDCDCDCDTCGHDHSAEHYRRFSPSELFCARQDWKTIRFIRTQTIWVGSLSVEWRIYLSPTISVHFHMSHYTIMQSNVTPVLYMMYLNAALILWIEMAQLHNMLGNLHVNEVAHINIAEHIICSFLDNQYLISCLDPIINHTHITWCTIVAFLWWISVQELTFTHFQLNGLLISHSSHCWYVHEAYRILLSIIPVRHFT